MPDRRRCCSQSFAVLPYACARLLHVRRREFRVLDVRTFGAFHCSRATIVRSRVRYKILSLLVTRATDMPQGYSIR